MTTTVELNGLSVDCIIGDLPDERTREQRLVVDVALEGDFSRAAVSDDLAGTVDYAALARRIASSLRSAKCRLVERAAAVVANVCLADEKVERVTVRVTKPGCVEGLSSASVRIQASTPAAVVPASPPLPLVIVANGETPSGPALAMLLSAKHVIACDGALARSRACGREPDFVVGDGDSISAAERDAIAGRFVRFPNQDDNDLAKAFRFARATFPDAARIAIVGAGGAREDHLIGNVFRLSDFAEEVADVSMATNCGLFEVVLSRREFACAPGSPVSVFAPNPATTVSSEGLEWPLDGVDLSRLPTGTLNRASADHFTLQSSSPIIVYRPWHW